MRKALMPLLLALTLLLTGCGPTHIKTEAAVEDGLDIVVTVFPAYDLARAAVADLANVTLLLPPGAESHSYEPTPADILAVQECDLFIYLGGESDTWVETILSSIDLQGDTMRMVDCVELLDEVHVEGMQNDPGHDHDHGHETDCDDARHDHAEGTADDHAHEEHEETGHAPEAEALLHDNHDHDEHDHEAVEHNRLLGAVIGKDEHVWTSPKNAAKIVRDIGAKLAELDGANADSYRANAEAYALELDALHGEFQDFFRSLEHRTIVFGDRFPLQYFAEEYELDYYAAFPGCSTQTEPSAATIAFLTDKVAAEDISHIFYIEFSNHLVADSIAEACGVETALFHSCHNVSRQELEAGVTYLTLMRQNLETLKATLK